MSHAEKVVSNIIQIEIHRCKQNPRLMPGIDIASSCSSLLTPAEEYLRYPTYGEHLSFDLCDADDTLLAHQHGACSWAERDAHAGALAAAAAAEAEEAEAEEKKNDEKAKARVRDRKRREQQQQQQQQQQTQVQQQQQHLHKQALPHRQWSRRRQQRQHSGPA